MKAQSSLAQQFSLHRSNESANGLILMAICLVFFTGTGLLVRWVSVDHHVDTWTLVFARGFIGLIVIALWYGPRGDLKLTRVLYRPALIFRGVVGATGLMCYYWTIPRLGVGVATLVSNVYVLFGSLLAALFLGEKLSIRQLGWLVVSLAGVALLTNVQATHSNAIWVALLGSVAAGNALMIIRYLHRTESTATIFAAQCVYAMAATLPILIKQPPQLGGTVWVWIVVASVGAALGQLTLTQAFRTLTVTVGGAVNLTLPIWITLGGMLFFGERFSLLQVLGGALVLTGCFQVVLKRV